MGHEMWMVWVCRLFTVHRVKRPRTKAHCSPNRGPDIVGCPGT